MTITPFLFLAFYHQSRVSMVSLGGPPVIYCIGFIRATASRVTCDEGTKSVFNLDHKSRGEKVDFEIWLRTT